MAKLAFAVAFLLVTVASAFRIEDIEERREYDEGTPEMLRERGLIPEYDDDPDVYRDTAWLLDRIIMDGAEVVPAVVIYRFGSGKKQECIDGKKTIPAQCQWTGWVIEEEGGNPVETKLTVSKKYCNAAGHTKPEDKVIDC